MNYKIYVNDDEINKLLTKLQQVEKDMQEFISNQQLVNEKMHNQWSGTSGDKSYDTIVEHGKKYNLYLLGLKKRRVFLENVKNAYFELDDKLNKKLDENLNTEM